MPDEQSTENFNHDYRTQVSGLPVVNMDVCHSEEMFRLHPITITRLFVCRTVTPSMGITSQTGKEDIGEHQITAP